MNFLALLMMVAGLVFLIITAIGCIRLPDFYTRSHAIGVVDTLAISLVVGSLALFHGFSLVSIKLFFLLAFIYIANPTVTHVFVRAALKSGLKPWKASDD